MLAAAEWLLHHYVEGHARGLFFVFPTWVVGVVFFGAPALVQYIAARRTHRQKNGRKHS